MAVSLIEKIALKPCRFCGSVWVVVNRPANGSHLSVKCKQCNAHGPGHAGITEAEAIAAWNNRAALTAIMGAGDGVQQCDRDASIELYGELETLLHYHEREAITEAFARHRSTAAAAERARIVAWLEKWITDTMGADMDPKWVIDAIERGEV